MFWGHSVGGHRVTLTGRKAGQEQYDPAAYADVEGHAKATDERRHCAEYERVLDWYEKHVDGYDEEHIAHGEPEQHACIRSTHIHVGYHSCRSPDLSLGLKTSRDSSFKVFLPANTSVFRLLKNTEYRFCSASEPP